MDLDLTVQRPQPHPIVIIINSQSLRARDDLNGEYSRSNESIIWKRNGCRRIRSKDVQGSREAACISRIRIKQDRSNPEAASYFQLEVCAGWE
jgi:hypothetical protein